MSIYVPFRNTLNSKASELIKYFNREYVQIREHWTRQLRPDNISLKNTNNICEANIKTIQKYLGKGNQRRDSVFFELVSIYTMLSGEQGFQARRPTKNIKKERKLMNEGSLLELDNKVSHDKDESFMVEGTPNTKSI
jgi:hypothetical protein